MIQDLVLGCSSAQNCEPDKYISVPLPHGSKDPMIIFCSVQLSEMNVTINLIKLMWFQRRESNKTIIILFKKQ